MLNLVMHSQWASIKGGEGKTWRNGRTSKEVNLGREDGTDSHTPSYFWCTLTLTMYLSTSEQETH